MKIYKQLEEEKLYHFVPYCKWINGEWCAQVPGKNVFIPENGLYRYSHGGIKKYKIVENPINLVSHAQMRIKAWKGRHPDQSYTLDHINRKRQDCRLINLRWASRRLQIYNRVLDYSKRRRPYVIYCNETRRKLATFYTLKKVIEFTGCNQNKMRDIFKRTFFENRTLFYIWDGYRIELQIDESMKLLQGEEFRNCKKCKNSMFKISNMGRVMGGMMNTKIHYGILNPVDGRYVAYPGGMEYSVSVLVYQTFIGPIPPGMEVDHIDNNPLNNRVDNLQLLTREENMAKEAERRRLENVTE